MGIKPPAAVGERISYDGRHDLGDASPFSTRTSSLQGRSGGSAIMPKLVELDFGPGSTRQAEKPSPCIACMAVAAPSVRSRVFVLLVRLPPWRDVTVKRHALGLLSAVPKLSITLLFSCLIFILIFEMDPPARVGQTRLFLLGERGPCPRGQSRRRGH